MGPPSPWSTRYGGICRGSPSRQRALGSDSPEADGRRVPNILMSIANTVNVKLINQMSSKTVAAHVRAHETRSRSPSHPPTPNTETDDVGDVPAITTETTPGSGLKIISPFRGKAPPCHEQTSISAVKAERGFLSACDYGLEEFSTSGAENQNKVPKEAPQPRW